MNTRTDITTRLVGFRAEYLRPNLTAHPTPPSVGPLDHVGVHFPLVWRAESPGPSFIYPFTSPLLSGTSGW